MIKNLITKLFTGILILYLLLATMIFTPLYNWRYARENGVVKWVLFGEIVATFKAFIWPYFILADRHESVSYDYPKLTANETDELSKIISKAQVEELNENDISALIRVFTEYSERTGTKIKKSEVEAFTKVTEIANDYYYELGQSLLTSWDSKSKLTTNNFDRILKLVKENGIRNPEKIKMDLICLDAAARNQYYVENDGDSKFEFGREIILQKLRENEIARNNFDKIQKVFNENSRE